MATLGLTRKKSLHAAEQEREDVKRDRATWHERLDAACDGDLTRVLFVDETGPVTNLTRTHGRCEEGERCVARVSAGHWRTMTAVAARRCTTRSATRWPR